LPKGLPLSNGAEFTGIRSRFFALGVTRRSGAKIPLPRYWPAHAKSALVHAVALAHRGLTAARGWCADSRLVRVRQTEEIAGLKADIGALREEIRIKDARLGPSP
jgi:hypothetical protein